MGGFVYVYETNTVKPENLIIKDRHDYRLLTGGCSIRHNSITEFSDRSFLQ